MCTYNNQQGRCQSIFLFSNYSHMIAFDECYHEYEPRGKANHVSFPNGLIHQSCRMHILMMLNVVIIGSPSKIIHTLLPHTTKCIIWRRRDTDSAARRRAEKCHTGVPAPPCEGSRRGRRWNNPPPRTVASRSPTRPSCTDCPSSVSDS